jgi:hypothetical protein
MHISRSFDGGGHIEANCPCPLLPCGFVDTDNVSDECDQHPLGHFKAIRSSHPAHECPGVGRDVVIAVGKTHTAHQAVLNAASLEPESGYFNASLLGALDDYRAAVEHEAAQRIRAEESTMRGDASEWREGLRHGADTIDPEVAT